MYCKNCGKELTGYQKEFCSNSCSAVFNNKNRRKIHLCLNCGKPLKDTRTKYCSNKCQVDHQYIEYIKLWKDGTVSGRVSGSTLQISNHLRRYLFEKYDNKCCLCGWGMINPQTGKSPLEIHHIDGNAENNSEDNLQLLCPNCHSLTPNYKNLNKHSSRIR